MNLTAFDGCKRDLFTLADNIASAKRPAYTGGNVDVLHNFKTTAQRCGILWAIMPVFVATATK